MNYITILLIVLPFIIYKIILKIIKAKFDIEVPKMESMMIFITIDIVIFNLYSYLF